jgi:membrane-bound lytic murein transglycosylase A
MRCGLFSVSVFLSACGVLPVNQSAPAPEPSTQPSPPAPLVAAPQPQPSQAPSQARLAPVALQELPGYGDDTVSQAWPALLKSCDKLAAQAAWQRVCAQARALVVSEANVRAFLLQRFDAFAMTAQDGKSEGLLTGYYEPVLKASLTRRAPFVVPLYGPPDDLAGRMVNGERQRGRMVNGQFAPYLTRAELTPANGTAHPALRGKEIAWLEDAVDAFFLQVQGSGRLILQDGTKMRVAFTDMNGHAYKSIGRTLIERGELKQADASAQSIKAWARANPAKAPELLNTNPGFVFFKLLPDSDEGPAGALNVPLTERRSVAVDTRYVPLGAPVWISAQHQGQTLNQLALAQDTGTAIKGEVRADYYWGSGEKAGEQAGRMRAPLKMWLLLPKPQQP